MNQLFSNATPSNLCTSCKFKIFFENFMSIKIQIFFENNSFQLGILEGVALPEYIFDFLSIAVPGVFLEIICVRKNEPIFKYCFVYLLRVLKVFF